MYTVTCLGALGSRQSRKLCKPSNSLFFQAFVVVFASVPLVPETPDVGDASCCLVAVKNNPFLLQAPGFEYAQNTISWNVWKLSFRHRNQNKKKVLAKITYWIKPFLSMAYWVQHNPWRANQKHGWACWVSTVRLVMMLLHTFFWATEFLKQRKEETVSNLGTFLSLSGN